MRRTMQRLPSCAIEPPRLDSKRNANTPTSRIAHRTWFVDISNAGLLVCSKINHSRIIPMIISPLTPPWGDDRCGHHGPTIAVAEGRHHMRSILAIFLALGFAAPAAAQQMVPGTVTTVRTGWNSDSFAVVIDTAQVNPAGCTQSAPGTGYVSDSSLPGYHTYYAAVLTAYITRRRVTITVHNTECQGGRTWPKLIGINLD
jgi:hypothetical protein